MGVFLLAKQRARRRGPDDKPAADRTDADRPGDSLEIDDPVRLPDTPSTPSEQLVALIDTQIRPEARGRASHGGRVRAPDQIGSQMTAGSKPSRAKAEPMARAASRPAS